MLHRIYIDAQHWKPKLNKILKHCEDCKLPDRYIVKLLKPAIAFTVLTTSPDTDSERLFYNMWNKADKKEKVTLTQMLLKIIRE